MMTETQGLLSRQTENRIKKTGIALIILLSAVFFTVSVIGNFFGGTIWDRGIYALGSVIFAIAAGIMLRELPIAGVLRGLGQEEIRKAYVQVCSFAIICLMTLYYYNSGSEYGHSIATRIMNSAFAIGLLTMYRVEELQKKWISMLQTAVAAVFIFGACVREMDGKPLVMYVLSGMTAWIYVKLLACFFVRVKKKEIRTGISLYGVIVFLFFVGLVLFRNTRTWPLSIVVPFTTLYLYRFQKGDMNCLLKNFCYGCILAFWLMFGTAILFRPYYSFEFVRYPGWFSSVASAGLFWILVFGCGIACILAKVRKGEKLRLLSLRFELMTLGAVESYLLMGMSRTSMLGVAGFCTVTLFVVEIFYYKDNFKKILGRILLIICPVLVLFPAVYTLTRCVPAIVGRPVWITRAEWFSDRIEKHENPSSSKFMNVPQFAESFLEKMVGIDINLSRLAGAVSGPGDREDNIVDIVEIDGQLYPIKDYTFHNESTSDLSNGRFDIFKLYLSQLNLTGHDSMLADPGDMDIELFHAHNSFIQVAFDQGIFVGIIFLLVSFWGVISGVFYYKKNCSKVDFAIYPVIVIVSFIIAGLTEWVFHPSIPLGFALLIGLTPLIGNRSK